MTRKPREDTYTCPFCQIEAPLPQSGTAQSCPTCDIAIAVAQDAQRARALALAHLVDTKELVPPAPAKIRTSALPSGVILVAAWNPETLLSLSHAAAILGLQPRTLRQYAHEGKLSTVRPGARNWKVTRHALLAFLRARRDSHRTPYLRKGTCVTYRGAPYHILRRHTTAAGTRFDLAPAQGGPPALSVPASDFTLHAARHSSSLSN